MDSYLGKPVVGPLREPNIDSSQLNIEEPSGLRSYQVTKRDKAIALCASLGLLILYFVLEITLPPNLSRNLRDFVTFGQ